jgi:hypothetical protein
MQPVSFTSDNASPQENLVYSRRQIEWAIQAQQDLYWRYKIEGNEIVTRDNRGYIPGLRFRFPKEIKDYTPEEREQAMGTVREALTNMFPLTAGWEFKPNLETK